MTNLYSKGSLTLSVTSQSGAVDIFSGMNFFQLSNNVPLPVMASVSFLRIMAQGTVKETLPERLSDDAFLLKITSVKALDQKGESSGRSCQRSWISITSGVQIIPLAELAEAPE